jgi:hypothetical protein
MRPEELNFRIPGFEPLFGLEELAFYDEIFERAIRETNDRLAWGIIELYQGPRDAHHVCLGPIPVKDAVLKFGVQMGRR